MNLAGNIDSGVAVTGLAELEANLKRYAKDISGPEMETAILRTATEMRDDMRGRAPYFLRETIIAKPFSRNDKDEVAAFVAIDRNVKDANGTMVGMLAHLFEFGTGPRYRRTTKARGGGIGGLLKVVAGTVGGYTGRITPRPFFRPTVDVWRSGKLLDRLAAAAKSIIERDEVNDMWGGGMV